MHEVSIVCSIGWLSAIGLLKNPPLFVRGTTDPDNGSGLLRPMFISSLELPTRGLNLCVPLHLFLFPSIPSSAHEQYMWQLFNQRPPDRAREHFLMRCLNEWLHLWASPKPATFSSALPCDTSPCNRGGSVFRDAYLSWSTLSHTTRTPKPLNAFGQIWMPNKWLHLLQPAASDLFLSYSPQYFTRAQKYPSTEAQSKSEDAFVSCSFFCAETL